MKRNYVGTTISGVLRKSPGANLILLASIAGVVVASLLPPIILKRIIDVNLAGRTAEGLPLAAAAYLGAVFFAGLFEFLKEATLTVLGQRITRDIRSGMMRKLGRLPASYFSKNDTGATVSRLTNDVDAINSMFTGGVIGMIVDCFKIIGIVASIWIFNANLGMLTLAALPVIALITRFFQRRMLGAQVSNRTQTAALNSHISESVRNVKTIKVFHRERYMEGRYRDKLDENFRTVEKINFYDAIFPCVIQIARSLIIAAVVVLASKEIHFLGITAGMIAASIEFVSNLFDPVENIGMEFQSVQEAVAGIRRVNEFVSEKEDNAKDETLTAENIVGADGNVRIAFNGLSFSYGEGADVLADITIQIRAREKVSFTGRTGVGKTTLFRLVMGLLKPTKGSVTLNGVDAYAIPNVEKKKLFGYVDQGFAMIDGTVAEQISLKDESISREAIERAVALVGLHDYVAGLDKGYDTTVRGEALFSQGQRQLLAIARAIVLDPPILLLDEMTANLDSITEEKVVAALERAGESRTILAISHRPSSMIASDTVVILENGQVRDAGTPEELSVRDEWYRNYIQFGACAWR
jgi:ATP-binding cassette subfamily B protein